MSDYYLSVNELKEVKSSLKCRDKVYLTGFVFTARDAAHNKLLELIEKDAELPFELNGSIIYYAGPTPMKDDGTVGSFGPTTSCRMDSFSPLLYEKGLLATIGKGNRSKAVVESIITHKALYFCAEGGCGALISQSIKEVKEIAFLELGCESIKKLYVENMPLVVAIDSTGESIFNRNY